MLTREPELAYNTENKRMPRGGRARGGFYTGTTSYAVGSIKPQKRDAEGTSDEEKEDAPMMIQEDSVGTYHSKTYWVNLFNGFAEMTDPISSDLALFLYCMLK